MLNPIDFVGKSAGFYVPPLIGLAVNPLGRFQPCGEGNCCFDPANCNDCGDSLAPAVWIDLPSLSNVGCSFCADYSGTYAVSSAQHCFVQTGILAPCPPEDFITVEYRFEGGKCYLDVKIFKTPVPFGIRIWWRLRLLSPASPLDHIVPFFFEAPVGCSGVGTTVHVYQ